MLYKNILLQKYFLKNEEHLKSFYPGISETIFIQKLQNLTSQEILKAFPLIEQGFPLSYITGEHFFFKHDFIVSPAVLIPRFETEILVELALQKIKAQNVSELKVLDLCSGSGCIGLSLLSELKNKTIKMFFADISAEALEISQRNYKKLRCHFGNHQAQFIVSDLLSSIDHENRFDVIVSNPPYIKKELHQEGVHLQVALFEPSLALFLEDGHYEDWFERYFQEIQFFLHESGFALIEGHEDELENLERIAQKYFTSTKLIKDYSERFRFILLKH